MRSCWATSQTIVRLPLPRGGDAERGGDGRLADAALAGHEDQALVEDRGHWMRRPAQTAATPGRAVPRGRNTPTLCEYPPHDGFTPAIRATRVPARARARRSDKDAGARAATERRQRPPCEPSPLRPPRRKEVTACSANEPHAGRRLRPQVRQQPRPARHAAREGDRLRQPEGRRRQDHHDPQPGRGLRRGGPPRAGGRHGPAGQPHDEPGHRPRHGREVDVRRAGRQHPDPRGRSASARSTSPAPRSTWPAPRSR